MVEIKGVQLELELKSECRFNEEERFYIGVCGKGKAREFPVYGYDDFNAGTDVKCRFGDVWEEDLRTNVKDPFKVNSFNDTRNIHVDLDKVNRVYLRKQSHSGKGNVWEVNGVEVTLYGSEESQKRKIYKSRDCGHALEYGIKVWMKERC